MNKPDIVISEFMDERARTRLLQAHRTHYDPALYQTPDALYPLLGGARVLIVRNLTRVDRRLLDHAPRLEMVGRLGVGLDNIDLDTCRARGISVVPARGANAAAVAEYVITASLVLSRRAAFSASADVIAGNWPRQRSIGDEIGGKTLGLIGYGNIARAVARRALGMDMHVVAHDPHVPADNDAWRTVKNMPFESVIDTADVISLHVPLLAQTRNLIDRAALARMKRGAIIINTSRGGIVDEEALADALRTGHVGGAALDVFAHEPLTAAAAKPFAGLANVLLSPHIAGVTTQSGARVGAYIADAALKALQ